ncbi:uncharacterized protein [Sinocyclocheilus grahami]|uniref:uncharacterized protein n=1 Tax=Sinocyclocheilus grahami TaxID=75366 RepID=UPI0007ACB640|nr:PREDICTED: uncharacterized protein LOC107589360 [Sinocyclocheilus grahami]
MSESIARKIQPFTIGTKLSAPAVPKCSDFPDGFLPNQTFSDNCKLRHLNEQVSLYLGRDRHCGPAAKHRREEMSDDHLNRNTVSPPNTASRSIRKITISSRMEAAKDRLTPGMELKKIRANSENINNNNNITSVNTQLPKIVGVSYENKPSSQFKVLLCKDGEKQCSGDQEKFASSPQDVVDSLSCEHKDVCLVSKVSSVQNEHSFTHQNAIFNKEITQAETWIRVKLRDLRDASNVHRCPLTDWEELCQTLQRDLRDFENTVIQLNQVSTNRLHQESKRLMNPRQVSTGPSAKINKRTLRRPAEPRKAFCETSKITQNINFYTCQQEQEQSLANILGENTDKMQLTRKILDLKQDEQLYHNLHEEINHMTLRLEKQGKTEGKTISTRRKHINKMWLKAQSHLKEYHENLQLALEVSSFYQQADNIVCSISNMRKGLSASNGVENARDGEIRDIASQIMVRDPKFTSHYSHTRSRAVKHADPKRVSSRSSSIKTGFFFPIRNEKAAQLPSTSSLTRDSSDPETPSQESPGSVGTDPHRIMGKEVKEEQNRLKGFTAGRDAERCGKPSDSRDAGEMAALKLHTAAESGNVPRPESSGHTLLHTQLQKFTVSADKTLSWLKDSVAMATQICSLAGTNGFEAAKRRQASLEQDILSNRARIELVKKEGYSLVRAQHPGSIKIQEFLSQLEVLWDELKRRHERNGLVLKISEELNYRVVRMLQSLASLEAWLEAVELSIRQTSLAGDPESVSVVEQESCQLEQELEARRLELQNLRQEVDHLSSQRHLHTPLLPARLKDVEMKFSSVQMALTQQSSELKDTRMLTEFLEKLELEESHYSTLGQPLCSELDSGPSLLGLPVSRHDEPLMQAIGNPVKELREAVEMLNDTARERGRSQSHDQSIQELLTRHAMVSAHVEQCLQRCAELAVDVLEIESEMAVRCEPDRCGLDDLQEYQDQLEAEYGVLKEEVEAMASLASCLSDVCPERMNAVGTEIQTSLNAWDELGKSVAENKKRLLQFGHLRHFFRNYLAMISWTEDTRSCIFSESALRQSRENQEPLVEVLDRQIEQKFEEFDQLAVAGKNLFDDEHHLNTMIRERMEELRSMLGWILVHWRAQKDQLLSRQKAEEAQTDAIYSEAMACSPQTQVETSPEVSQKTTESLTSAPPGDTEDGLQHSYGYEVMQSVSSKGSDDSSHLQRPDSPYLVLKEPSPSALGATVNLILSFSNSGDTQIQVQAPGREGGVPVPEPVHRPAESHSSACKGFWKRCQGLFGSLKRKTKIYRHSAEEVSTYLHVTENNTAVYESMALPQDKAPRPSSSSPRTSLYALSSPCTSPYSSSSIEDTLQQANNLLPKNGNISIFSSLKRKGKKAKKKKDDRRHTIQKIMGEDLSEEADLPPVREPVTYDTHTWPLKERKKRKNARKPNSDGTQVLDYIKNPLVKDIDAECSGEVGSPVHSTLEVATQGHVKNHCRFLSLGSVLSFDLPKDMSLIPSIQDVITIGPPEQKKTDSHHQDSQVDRLTALSTFKTVRSRPMQKEERKQISPGEVTLKIDCKDSKKISIDKVSFTEDEYPPPPSPVVEDISFEENHPSSLSDLTNIQQKHLSGISIVPKEEEVSWNANATQLENPYVSPPEDAIQGIANHCSTMAEIHVCPSVHTLVHNLNGHMFHRPAKNSSTQQLSPSHASHVVLNFRANGREDSVDSGHSSSGSFKLCAEGPHVDSSDCPVPKKTIGKVPSLDAGVSNKNFEFSKDKSITLSIDIDDPVHPDHQQFEQEEEELEDIWNHTNSYRESLNSDIMYNGYQATSSLDQHREPSPKEQAVLFRKLVTASAPNLLVAEFRLPPSVQTMVGSGKQQNPREERPILDKGDRRSWAAFTQQEQVYKQVAVNETASDMVKLPEIQDQQKYIYHYREEEEEEEEEEEKETGFLKDQSMSHLSVHMGLDGTNDNDIQTGRQELELPSMEGTLERKHRLQLGGKKAPCRAWNSYHAVLYKQTICFYQDRKDTLKSCVTSLPLNLVGAVCEPSSEYTKKPNCFCLRLRDGSEYLLSASSRFMMKKWILRIQAHTVSSDSVVNRSTCHGSSASATLPRHSLAITGCQCGDKCHCSMRNYVTTTVLAQSQPASGRTKEIIVHTSDALQIHQRHQDPLLPSFSDAGHCEDEFDSHGESLSQKPSSMSTIQGWTSEKRRSHSFTSATYQRIKPVAPPSGKGQDSSSSYSVTLFIGDGEMPAICKSTATASPNSVRQEPFSDLPMRSYMSLPRPPNKSVFRKFFGKKE